MYFVAVGRQDHHPARLVRHQHRDHHALGQHVHAHPRGSGAGFTRAALLLHHASQSHQPGALRGHHVDNQQDHISDPRKQARELLIQV